ncbi:MAG: hypothetical protein JXA20_10720 [Spirochaetes bacterium]|nr:hypothetical protein [Spirochaetota bacterium]
MRFWKTVAAVSAMALSCALYASAQGHGGPFAAMDSNRDGKISKSEWETFHKSRIAEFSSIDNNGDGNLEDNELRDFHMKKMGPPPGGMGKGEPPHGARFGKMPVEKMDGNNDGKISRAEWDTFHRGMFEKLDANHDSFIERVEMKGPGMRFGKEPPKK